MARFDELPADQKAVLQLVLRQGRSYDQIAGLLKISPEAVRERAHAALDALGPASGPGAERRADLADYLLAQQDEGERITTYAFLDGSAAGRAWARVVAGELRGAGLTDADALPEVPADGTDDAEAEPPRGDEPAAAPAGEHPAAASAAAAAEPVPAAATSAGSPAPGRPAAGERVSRTGGIILLGAVAAAVVVGVLALVGVFGGGDDDKSQASATGTTQTQTSTTGGQTKVEAQVNLRPPRGGSKALGVANVVSQDGQRAIAVIGQNLAPSNRYVLWLAKGDTSKFLGFFPAVQGKGGQRGRLQGLVAAPDDLANYDTMLITRETVDQPKSPGSVVLRGTVGQQ